LAVLNTDNLGLSGVPLTFVRTLFFLFNRALALLTYFISLTLCIFHVIYDSLIVTAQVFRLKAED
jgi:hypothetical protein